MLGVKNTSQAWMEPGERKNRCLPYNLILINLESNNNEINRYKLQKIQTIFIYSIVHLLL